MAIIRSANARNVDQAELAGFDESQVPFVPAWDLLQSQQRGLNDEEAAAVAIALYLLAPDPSEQLSPWNMGTRFEAVSRRL